MRVDLVDGPPRVVRYISGTTIYEEALMDTRWTGRAWTATGYVEPPAKLESGLSRQEAFSLEVDGQSLHAGWEWEGSQQPAAPRAGQLHQVVTLSHQTRPVRVTVHTVLDGTPVLERWLDIENTGNQPAAMSRAWCWSGRLWPHPTDHKTYDRPQGSYRLGYFADHGWAREGRFAWQPIGLEPAEIGEEHGQSGWGHPIAYFQDQVSGVLYVTQLAWSGNWTIRVNPRGGLVTVQVGPTALGPMRVIEPSETIRTPSVHVGCVVGELSDMVQALHAHQRRSVLVAPPQGRANLVHYNHWSYVTEEMTEERLIEQVDIAADLGAEVFTIDAGWFGDPGTTYSESGLGEWRPAGRLPNGLDPVFDHARGKGLLCGLWCWIEAALSTSRIIREHPDWLVHIDGKPQERQLDVAKADVAEWVESELVRIVEEYKLDLFRLDFNRAGEDGTNPRGGFDENGIWRHYEAMYAIWERVRERFPDLILENCAGGGGRTDLGMLSRFHFTWMSDHTLAPRTIRVQNGMTMALPPEILARAFGVAMEAHTMGDVDLQLRMNFLLGNPCISGVWPEPKLRHSLLRERILHAIDLFRREIRPMMPSCKVYHHTPELLGDHPEGWCVMEYASPDASKSILGVFRLAGGSQDEYLLRPRGLRRDAAYSVYLDNRAETVLLTGHDLMDDGLRIRLGRPLTSELIIAKSQVTPAQSPTAEQRPQGGRDA
jgi:alpha-galactosidase